MGKSLLDCILDKVVDKTIDAMGGKDAVNGKIGEAYTARELKLLNLLGRKGKVLRNVYIPKDNNETSEIDVLFITQKGIFVIESKNYSGWIFGSENQYKWTMMLPNKEKHSFYNPIKQNQTHIIVSDLSVLVSQKHIGIVFTTKNKYFFNFFDILFTWYKE